MIAEPQLHLRKHVLVNFLESLGFLSSLGLLLVEILVGELLKVLCINLLHDKVQRTRCDEFSDGAWVTWQILERRHPVDQRVLDSWTISEWVSIASGLLRQERLSETVRPLTFHLHLPVRLFLLQVDLDYTRRSMLDVTMLAVHLQVADTAAKFLVVLGHVIESTSHLSLLGPVCGWAALRRIFWRLYHVH